MTLIDMRRASRVADEAFQYALSIIGVGLSEQLLSSYIDHYITTRSEGLSFPTIINSSKERPLNIHSKPSTKLIREGDLVMMDFGAVCGGFCSDISRTVIMGKANKRQKALYDLVLEANKLGIELVKAGITLIRVEEDVRKLFKKKRVNKWFSHYLGHGIGKELHGRPGNFTTLKAGEYVTIEPSLYIKGFGSIRIEDVVAIKKSGVEVLNKAPKELIEVDV